MFAITTLSVHPDTLYQLLDHLRESNSPLNPAEAAEQALRSWLAAAREQRGRSGAVLHGYRWKQLFLPEGTRLRIWLRHDHGHAEVVGDALHYDGLPISPNAYVRLCTGTHRNAWELISILLPGAAKWVPASVMRAQAAPNFPPAAAATPAALPEPAPETPAPRPALPAQKRWGERRAWNVAGRRETDYMPEPVIIDH